MTSMQDARDVVELTVLRDSREVPSASYNVSSGFAVCLRVFKGFL